MGAWIETDKGRALRKVLLVAPYVGAWIETYYEFEYKGSVLVAPYVGAWIETVCFGFAEVC